MLQGGWVAEWQQQWGSSMGCCCWDRTPRYSLGVSVDCDSVSATSLSRRWAAGVSVEAICRQRRMHSNQVEPLKYIARSPTLGDKAAFQCWWCSKAAWLTKPPLLCVAASASASSNDPPNAAGQSYDSIVSTACHCCVGKPVKILPCVLAPRSMELTTRRQPSAGPPHTYCCSLRAEATHTLAER